MTARPEIDPAWIRRRPQYSQDDPTNTVAVLVLLLMMAGAFYFLRERIRQPEAVERVQTAASQPAAPAAVPNAVAPAVEAQHPVGTGSSIGDKAIHRCGYAGNTTYQLSPCSPPWQELAAEQSSREQRAYDDALMRQRAAEKLRLEQARWSAASGSSSNLRSWDAPAISSAQSVRARCAAAKRDRDAAYELAGVNRSFEMIRRWSDIVFEACKE